jgi:hypothetical protein
MSITRELLNIPINPDSKDMSLTVLDKTDLIAIPGNPVNGKDARTGEQWYVLSTSEPAHPLYVGITRSYDPGANITRFSARVVTEEYSLIDLGGTETEEWHRVESVVALNFEGRAWADGTGVALGIMSCALDCFVYSWDGTDGHPTGEYVDALNFGQPNFLG